MPLIILKPFLKITAKRIIVMPKKTILLILFIIFYTVMHAQVATWMIGTWESRSSSGSITSTIQISDVSIENFTGTKTSKVNNDSVTISISGGFTRTGLNLQDGAVVHKPANLQWNDCAACTQENRMMIGHDSLVLVRSISGCNNSCDGETVYYRLLSEYDDETQHYLVDRFGRPSDIIGFHPYHPQEQTTVTSNNDSTAQAIKQQEEQRHQDSLDNLARIKQQIDNSTRLAQQRKREQELADSLKLVQQKEKRHISDSLDNAARLEKIRLQHENSVRDVQAKKRRQEIADSLSLAQQKEQQRIKDSLDNIARIKQQQTDDATRLAQQKKREKEIADSLSLVQQKEQQRINDSLNKVARLEQLRQQTEDSLRNAQAKKRQQEVADSLNLVNQREQQRIKDSLQSVAASNLQKQRTADSLNNVLAARRRQQQVTDSLMAVRKQQYNDSLQKVALAKAVPPPATDSALPAGNKVLITRTSILLGTYHITTPDILIELFDNGEIDGDRVSVFHNKEVIVSNQTLGIKPITMNIHADTANREHEFVLVAENLGSIPPNSALMRITVGKQIYKLSVNTDMKTNARIVFYYDGN